MSGLIDERLELCRTKDHLEHVTSAHREEPAFVRRAANLQVNIGTCLPIYYDIGPKGEVLKKVTSTAA